MSITTRTTLTPRFQADYSEMNITCQKRFRIEEKKIEAMEYAMKQLTLENDKLKRELQLSETTTTTHDRRQCKCLLAKQADFFKFRFIIENKSRSESLA